VSFDWAYVTADSSPVDDPFGYLLNGAFTQLTVDYFPNIQSGSKSLSVLAADVFGFRQSSADSTNGRASTSISNLNGPLAAPARHLSQALCPCSVLVPPSAGAAGSAGASEPAAA